MPIRHPLLYLVSQLCVPALVAAALVTGSARSHAAENLVQNGDGSAGTSGWRGLRGAEQNPDGAGTALRPQPGQTAVTVEDFPVDTGKTYRLFARFRSLGSEPANVYFGVQCLDENGRTISSISVTPEAGTATVLTDHANTGATTVRVQDASRWSQAGEKVLAESGAVAFDVDDTGEFRDLPSQWLSRGGIKSIRQDGASWEIELGEPLGKDYPAGTKVRLHRDGWGACWPPATRKVEVPGGYWTDLSAEITGTAPGNSNKPAFWPGTRSVRVAIHSPDDVIVTDVSFSE